MVSSCLRTVLFDLTLCYQVCQPQIIAVRARRWNTSRSAHSHRIVVCSWSCIWIKSNVLTSSLPDGRASIRCAGSVRSKKRRLLGLARRTQRDHRHGHSNIGSRHFADDPQKYQHIRVTIRASVIWLYLDCIVLSLRLTARCDFARFRQSTIQIPSAHRTRNSGLRFVSSSRTRDRARLWPSL